MKLDEWNAIDSVPAESISEGVARAQSRDTQGFGCTPYKRTAPVLQEILLRLRSISTVVLELFVYYFVTTELEL